MILASLSKNPVCKGFPVSHPIAKPQHLSLQLENSKAHPRYLLREITCLPVKFLFVFHPHVLRKGIVVFVRVTVDDHVFTDDARASAAATWVFHGCAFDSKSAIKK